MRRPRRESAGGGAARERAKVWEVWKVWKVWKVWEVWKVSKQRSAKHPKQRSASRLPTREDDAGGDSEPKRTVGQSFAADEGQRQGRE